MTRVSRVASNASSGGLADGLRVQSRVIGAIMLRELHTRFGRNNIGYLWLLLEPMILANGVAIFHVFTHLSLPYGFSPGPFYASGYITYIVFRNNVNRAASTIEANKPLLFHKCVTLVDVSMGRSFLEIISTVGAMIATLSLFMVLGLSPVPQRPWLLLLAIVLMGLLSTAFAMIITGANELFPVIERFVHPLTYLIMPFTGMFFVLGELPPQYANILKWLLVPQITDLSRMGLLNTYNSPYIDPLYIAAVISITLLLGFSFMKIARRRMHFD